MYVDARAGEPVDALVTFKNQTLVDASFEVELADMQAGPGDDDAFDYVDVGSAPRGAASWMQLKATGFELAAGTERPVVVRIDVPPDAGAGGHFAALLSTVRATRPTGQFDVDLVTPIPIFVTVEGEYERDLRVRIAPDDPLRWSGGEATWTVELANEGDVHEIVGGRVRLQSLLSGTSSAPLRSAILLPGETRRRSVEFALRSAPDAWTAQARIEREGADARRASSERVWVVPWWIALVLAALALVTWWRLRVRRARAREEFIPLDDAPDDGFE